MDKKKTDKKREKSPSDKKEDEKEKLEETKSNGLPEDIDFKKFLGCGG